MEVQSYDIRILSDAEIEKMNNAVERLNNLKNKISYGVYAEPLDLVITFIKKFIADQSFITRFPCKLGDTIYWISDEDTDGNPIPTIMETEPISGIAIQQDGVYIRFGKNKGYCKVGTINALLTQEQAEQALLEMKGA